MDASLVRWPGEEALRVELAAEGVPRLLLVDAETPAPSLDDCFEDWIRVPASEEDLNARLRALTGRVRHHVATTPALDDDGVVRFGGGWVALPPVEARLTAALVERYGAVVSRDALARAGWPAGAPRRNALDVHVLRLRRRLRPVGLVIKTVRSRGYLLEPVPARQEPSR